MNQNKERSFILVRRSHATANNGEVVGIESLHLSPELRFVLCEALQESHLTHVIAVLTWSL